MKPVVLVTQRVDVIAGRNEKRDALDQRLVEFLVAAGFAPLPVPNHILSAVALFNNLPVTGLVFSGGNDLAALGGDAPERDATERELLRLADAHNLPVLGICRGMQFLIHETGGKLARIADHVATRHAIFSKETDAVIPKEVNSFHQWAVRELPTNWIEQARSADNSIEMAKSSNGKYLGIMWHPEREANFSEADINLVREHFKAAASS